MIPDELKNLNQWVNWAYKPGTKSKMPVSPNGGIGSSTDSTTWSTFERAEEQSDKIGFVFTDSDPYCGIDLDDCITDGKYTPEAIWILDKLKSYSEISPSGTGVKIWIRATKPEDCKS